MGAVLEIRASHRKRGAVVRDGAWISGILESNGTADGLSEGCLLMAIVPVSAADYAFTGRLCILCISDDADSGGVCVCLGTGSSGTGNYLFGT